MNVHDLLQTLVSTPGPPGLEDDIATVVSELWRPYVDDISADRLGNVVGVKYGNGPEPRRRVLLAAHMDEIALMVTDIVEHNGYGFLRVINVGGIDRRQLFGQRVTVHGQRNLNGVVAGLPNPMLAKERRGKAYNYDDFVVDVGCSAESVNSLVSIGDYVTIRQPLHKLAGGNVATKAIDNRASVAAVTACLEMLQSRSHSWDVVAVATVQEETRLLGAHIATFEQQPDIAVALDVGFAKQPGASEATLCDLGGGPVLDIGVDIHPGMLKAMQKSAKQLEMKVAIMTHARASGTDAHGTQISRTGVPTALISLGIRYMHTVVETIALKDITRTGQLLTEFITTLDDDFVDNLSAEMLAPVNGD